MKARFYQVAPMFVSLRGARNLRCRDCHQNFAYVNRENKGSKRQAILVGNRFTLKSLVSHLVPEMLVSLKFVG